VDRETERRVPKSKATHWCKSQGARPVPYYETSAKEAIKVEAAFLEVAQLALKQKVTENDIFIPDAINLSKQPAPVKHANNGCC